MSDFRPRSLSELRRRTEELFDPNAGYLDTVGGISKLSSGAGESLRTVNSDTTQSRMALPISDVAKSGVQSLATTGKFSQSTKPELSKPELSDLDRLKGAYDIDYKYRGLYGNQDIDLSKRKITEVDTLANNEANRAYGMQLATQFPYHKYDTEADAFKSVTNNMLSPSRFASLASTQIKPMQYVSL